MEYIKKHTEGFTEAETMF